MRYAIRDLCPACSATIDQTNQFYAAFIAFVVLVIAAVIFSSLDRTGTVASTAPPAQNTHPESEPRAPAPPQQAKAEALNPQPPIDPDYPAPTTTFSGKTAEEWWSEAAKSPGHIRRTKALDALANLKEEGIPFLLDVLERAPDGPKKQRVFNRIDLNLVQEKDILRFVGLLDYSNTRHLFLSAIPKLGKRGASLLPRLEMELQASTDGQDRAHLHQAILSIRARR